MKKPKEYWIVESESHGERKVFRHPSPIGTIDSIELKEAIVETWNKQDRVNIEAVHVIEYSAYQELLDQLNSIPEHHWRDVASQNILLEQKLNKAVEALKDAAEYHNTDDVNGEAGYIAWKALKEIEVEDE